MLWCQSCFLWTCRSWSLREGSAGLRFKSWSLEKFWPCLLFKNPDKFSLQSRKTVCTTQSCMYLFSSCDREHLIKMSWSWIYNLEISYLKNLMQRRDVWVQVIQRHFHYHISFWQCPLAGQTDQRYHLWVCVPKEVLLLWRHRLLERSDVIAYWGLLNLFLESNYSAGLIHLINSWKISPHLDVLCAGSERLSATMEVELLVWGIVKLRINRN